MEDNRFPYKDKITEVENIIAHLKADDIDDIEKMLSDVQKATTILADCRKHLTDLKTKLDDILEPKE